LVLEIVPPVRELATLGCEKEVAELHCPLAFQVLQRVEVEPLPKRTGAPAK
jgi:hypothetical protein